MSIQQQQGDEERRRQEEERHGYLTPICGCTHRGERENHLMGEDAKYLYTCVQCWQYSKNAYEAERKAAAEEHARKYPHYADAYDKRPKWERDLATGARDPFSRREY